MDEEKSCDAPIDDICCVAVGDVWSGITLYGPFRSAGDASEWIDEVAADTWEIVPILPLVEYED